MNYKYQPVEVRQIRRGDLVRKPGTSQFVRVISARGGSVRTYLFTNCGNFRPRRSDEWERVIPGSAGTKPVDAETQEDRIQRAKAEIREEERRLRRTVGGRRITRATGIPRPSPVLRNDQMPMRPSPRGTN